MANRYQLLGSTFSNDQVEIYHHSKMESICVLHKNIYRYLFSQKAWLFLHIKFCCNISTGLIPPGVKVHPQGPCSHPRVNSCWKRGLAGVLCDVSLSVNTLL
jgi:hypothetical protein